MKTSVILSTYNSVVWLEKVLWGFSAQTITDFEIVIADDGSNDETKEKIDALKKKKESINNRRIINMYVTSKSDTRVLYDPTGDLIALTTAVVKKNSISFESETSVGKVFKYKLK
jgi:glycosyltransferase involved in cell wall biosynthesis